MLPLPRTQARTAPDRRRHRRVPAQVSGRMLDPRQQERYCRTIDLSAGGALLEVIAADQDLATGDVVIYLDHIGRMPGQIVRSGHAGGIGVRFSISQAKRERIAEFLTALMAGMDPQSIEPAGPRMDRRAGRYAGGGVFIVETEDARRLECEALDFSLLGVALRFGGLRPALGAWVRLGATHGRVARYFDGGFAVDFASLPAKR